ncbi:DsbA family protein [Radicibacter daui]|uniref:DsbA family protein n=1 Tax=Radicibacter daui TaxID=3064829 RepID=UPI004046BFC6
MFTPRRRPLLSAALAMALVAGPLMAPVARADDAAPLSPAQQDAVRALVRETLVKNPEIIMEALQELKKQQVAQQEASQKGMMASKQQALYGDERDLSVGNLKGDVTLVEFMDYQCGYCKAVYQDLQDVVKADGNTRLVYKEYPILGPGSVLAAQAALASKKQGKYEEFHDVLMRYRGRMDEETVMRLAKSIDLDTDRLKTDMKSAEVTGQLQATMDLGRALGVDGTPGFVIGDKLVPGAISSEELKDLIDKKRAEG